MAGMQLCGLPPAPPSPQAQRGLEGKSHDVFPSEGLRMTGAYKMKTKTDSPRQPARLPIPPTQIRVPGPDAWSPGRQRRAKSHRLDSHSWKTRPKLLKSGTVDSV